MTVDQINDGERGLEPQAERARRIRVLKGARAVFNQQHSAVSCVVRDLSESGAKIEFDVGWIVPPHFTLFVELDGFKVECEKVWHRGNLYGVRFTGPRIPTNIVRRQRIDLCADTTHTDILEHNVPSQATGRKPSRPVFGKLK
jgi:hypothetical protein